jgi:hypothetical protein
MALTRLVGDIHGKTHDYINFSLAFGMRHASDPIPVRSVQVGDFGIGFAGSYWHEQISKWMKEFPQHRFIRGNHDDPAKCKEMPNYIADGTVEGDVMYLGGAWSIDHAYRTEGVSWWRDEELTIEELDSLIDLYAKTKPRVMITHDCPTQIAWDMFISRGQSLAGQTQIKTRTGEALQTMWEIHQPQEWYFGHWHQTRDLTLHGTRFQCLGELDFIDVEL